MPTKPKNNAFSSAVAGTPPEFISIEPSIFELLVTAMPGLVCCFELSLDREIKFSYLNDGCVDLLGLQKKLLWQQPHLLLNMMYPEDLNALFSMAKKSADVMSLLNWDGRVWMKDWLEFKWLNLRATPHIAENGQLHWKGIFTNISHSVKEKMALVETHQKLQLLTVQLERIKEEERKRLAREIHDEVGGNLSALKISLESMLQTLDANQLAIKEQLSYLLTVTDGTFDAVHRLIGDLNPSILEFGLIEALRWQADEFKRRTGIACTFTCNNHAANLNSAQHLGLYRVCQEALSNIRKHAQAKQVAISLDYLPGQDCLQLLQIEDDGIGIQPNDRLKPHVFGIKGMAERVAALGGVFSIAPATKAGTLVTVKFGGGG